MTITAADLPGFVASTEEAVKALPVPTEGSVFVIYNFKEEVDPSGGAGNASVEAVTFENGEYVRTTSSPVDHANASYYSNQGMIFLYTTAAQQAGQGGEGEEPEGIVDNGDGTYTVDWGTELSIVAVPAEDYHLVSWNGEPAASDTLKVTITDELSVSAFFKHDTYILTVEGVEVKNAKFADGTADAEVLNPGTLVGVQTGDNVQLTTTATFSSAAVGDNLTITVHYAIEVIDGGIYDNEYALAITDSILEINGFIIEPMTPDEDALPEDQNTDNKEGFDIYAYGYCKGNDIGFKFHLNSGKPDQYKIEFDKSKCDAICFTDIDWTDLEMEGNDGEVLIDIPMDMPTGDYSMTVTFRDSRFDLKSDPITVPFHVNLSETYVVALFDNVMAVVDTCECLTDIQWYWRADASQPWTMIEGATGYYYKQEGGLSGEYFIHAKMNGVDTYTCPQDDMTLYGDTKQAKVRAYPNPVVSTTTVTIENSYNYEHTLRVVNLNGWEVLRSTFEGNETTVDMDGFVQGNYMISVDGIVVKVMKK
ncbi:MAG: T9SS type A sorting domain-containing protein [Paludibacteraceae bacterium]|nr:T9SS type A sorting domain-containing protein [Paludibacteraceae bacterium]